MDFYDDRIDKSRPRTDHIGLYCVNHPTLRWHTKNIPGRSIFFSGEYVPEDGTFKQPCIDPTPPIRVLKACLNGRNPYNTDLEREGGPATWEEVKSFMAWVARVEDAGYTFECDCPYRDLEYVHRMPLVLIAAVNRPTTKEN